MIAVAVTVLLTLIGHAVPVDIRTDTEADIALVDHAIRVAVAAPSAAVAIG